MFFGVCVVLVLIDSATSVSANSLAIMVDDLAVELLPHESRPCSSLQGFSCGVLGESFDDDRTLKTSLERLSMLKSYAGGIPSWLNSGSSADQLVAKFGEIFHAFEMIRKQIRYSNSPTAVPPDFELDLVSSPFLSEKGVYVGFVKPDLFGKLRPHGFGMWISTDKKNGFIGEWYNGRRSGKGATQRSDLLYQGDWFRDYIHGVGSWVRIFEDNTKETYRGDFKKNKRCGEGVYAYRDGARFTGGWRDDMRHGFGKMTLVNGDVYEGEWEDELWHGKGEWISPRGQWYKGEFAHGKLNGQGVYGYPDSSVYEGEFRDSARSGKGALRFATGELYEGEWENDAMNGFGKYVYKDGSYWQGKWRNGKKHGLGEYVTPAGLRQVEFFHDGRRQPVQNFPTKTQISEDKKEA